ncbi:hypothetical protein CXG81DRAFT_16490 [Caulochytrium protostelioides]|uniref:T-box domain-containing protein n=1 Tax=Caulochytrium protostelioides TaxID=1555241 RepID=A0A4P9XES0_9FUNG|nr:hypothetical protein CXG81DRAFT_16490 [Caulochytrium protostelioides]|eukprot:RKP04063.1 hypothetical protein CXG81DRAFT_16490 [Caulochytrium protostelioides]
MKSIDKALYDWQHQDAATDTESERSFSSLRKRTLDDVADGGRDAVRPALPYKLSATSGSSGSRSLRERVLTQPSGGWPHRHEDSDARSTHDADYSDSESSIDSEQTDGSWASRPDPFDPAAARLAPRRNLSHSKRKLMPIRLAPMAASPSPGPFAMPAPMASRVAGRPAEAAAGTGPKLPPKMPSSNLPLVGLENVELWNQFHSVQNEMIITKIGRCLFPTLRFYAVHLEPKRRYRFYLDIALLTPCRFRFLNGTWHQATDVDVEGSVHPAPELYLNPLASQSGEFWMANGISFVKAKISNRWVQAAVARGPRMVQDQIDYESNGVAHLGKGHFPCTSFHMYQPRLHMIAYPLPHEMGQQARTTTFLWNQTRFIAVTHYQNERVNALKKDYNPHAKGFKDADSCAVASDTRASTSAETADYGFPSQITRDQPRIPGSTLFTAGTVPVDDMPPPPPSTASAAASATAAMQAAAVAAAAAAGSMGPTTMPLNEYREDLGESPSPPLHPMRLARTSSVVSSSTTSGYNSPAISGRDADPTLSLSALALSSPRIMGQPPLASSSSADGMDGMRPMKGTMAMLPPSHLPPPHGSPYLAHVQPPPSVTHSSHLTHPASHRLPDPAIAPTASSSSSSSSSLSSASPAPSSSVSSPASTPHSAAARPNRGDTATAKQVLHHGLDLRESPDTLRPWAGDADAARACSDLDEPGAVEAQRPVDRRHMAWGRPASAPSPDRRPSWLTAERRVRPHRPGAEGAGRDDRSAPEALGTDPMALDRMSISSMAGPPSRATLPDVSHLITPSMTPETGGGGGGAKRMGDGGAAAAAVAAAAELSHTRNPLLMLSLCAEILDERTRAISTPSGSPTGSPPRMASGGEGARCVTLEADELVKAYGGAAGDDRGSEFGRSSAPPDEQTLLSMVEAYQKDIRARDRKISRLQKQIRTNGAQAPYETYPDAHA